MSKSNTIYIAECLFSQELQKYDPEISFPPIKKIGITTGRPEKREKQLLGTTSPVKVSIIKAWTNVDAKEIELMLHNILGNSRLDGEYFWDGKETLVDAVTDFISTYHKEAQEIVISDDTDVIAASKAVGENKKQRIAIYVIPALKELGINYNILKGDGVVSFHLGDYRLRIGAKTGNRYTLTIWSQKKSTEDAKRDFIGSQDLSAGGAEDSDRRARIPMAKLEEIVFALKNFKNKKGKKITK